MSTAAADIAVMTTPDVAMATASLRPNAERSAAPPLVPAMPRKSNDPIWRRVTLTPWGTCQIKGPVRCRQPSNRPTTSGPPAAPAPRRRPPGS